MNQRWQIAFSTLAVLAVLLALAVGFICQRNRIDNHEKRLALLELRVGTLTEELQELRCREWRDWAELGNRVERLKDGARGK